MSHELLAPEAALRLILAECTALPAENCALDDALGRVLAEAVIAPEALPPFDNSAMDGFAARSAELPATLPVVAQVAAGQQLADPVPELVAIRILTGAPVPAGLDTVVMQEDATIEASAVTLPASPVGENIRKAGEDVADRIAVARLKRHQCRVYYALVFAAEFFGDKSLELLVIEIKNF